MLQAFSEALGGADTVQDRRVTVLKEHVEELTRQKKAQKLELEAANAKLKELKAERAAARPQEKKLFSRLEQLQVRRHRLPWACLLRYHLSRAG